MDYPELGKIKLFNNPVKFSGFEVEVRRPPKLGEHTEEILERLGYGREEIERLRGEGVI